MRAGPIGRVEREVAGGQFLEGLAVAGAGQMLGEREELAGSHVEIGCRRTLAERDHLDLHDTVGQPQRRLHGVGQALPDSLPRHQTVDHNVDVVHLVAGQIQAGSPVGVGAGHVGQFVQLAVDARPYVPVGLQLRQQCLVGALPSPHHGGEDLEACALGQPQHPVDDLLRRLAHQRLAGLGVVGDADASEQQAEVVVDLGDGADGGTRVARGALLVDGDGRREPFDEVHVGLVHLPQELPCIGGERLHVAALTLGVDGVEGQRRLPGPGDAREHDEAIPRQFEGDVAQVVLARSPDHQVVAHGPSVGGRDAHRRQAGIPCGELLTWTSGGFRGADVRPPRS